MLPLKLLLNVNKFVIQGTVIHRPVIALLVIVYAQPVLEVPIHNVQLAQLEVTFTEPHVLMLRYVHLDTILITLEATNV